jgi:hypothetical protein
MMRRLYLALAAFMALAAVSVVVSLMVVSSPYFPKQQVDPKQQLQETLEYDKHGDGMFVTCDAKIVKERRKCVPPRRGKNRVASCYAGSWEAVAKGDLSCTGDRFQGIDTFSDQF